MHIGGEAKEAAGLQTGDLGIGKLLGKPGAALPGLGGEAKTGNTTALSATSTPAVLEVCVHKCLARRRGLFVRH